MNKACYTIDEAIALTGYTKHHLYKVIKKNNPGLNFRINNNIPQEVIEHVVKFKKFIDMECCKLVSILEQLQISQPRLFKKRFPTIKIYNFRGTNYICKYDAENILEYMEFYKSEFYSKNEVLKLLDISYNTLLNNEHILKRHYFNGKVHIAKKHVKLFLDERSFYFNECYRSDAAAKLLGYNSVGDLYRAYPDIQKHSYSQQWYIPKQEINWLLHLTNKKNYYSINEVTAMLNYSLTYTRAILKSIPYIKIKALRYYSKDDIHQFINEIKQKEDYINKECYSQVQVLKLLGIGDLAFTRGRYDDLYNKKIFYKHANYYSKNDVHDFITKFKDSFNNNPSVPSDSDNPRNSDVFLQNITINLDDYLTLTEVSNMLNISKFLIQRLINSNMLNCTFYKSQYYISKKSIDFIKQFYSREYLTRKQLSEKMEISIHALDTLRKDHVFKDYFIERARGKYLIDEKHVECIKTTYTYVYFFLRCNTNLDLNERVNKCFDFLVDKDYPTSVKHYKKWTIEKFNKSGLNNKKKQEYCHDLIYTFFKVYGQLENLNCELSECNNEDIKFIINMAKFTETQVKYFCQYLNYFRHKYKSICKYTRDFSVSRELSYTKSSNIYTVEEWVGYYTYLSNISINLTKAIQDDEYAQKWLYSILHLSIAWRKSDIQKMPNIDILNKEFDFNWLQNNKLSKSDAQYIINYVNKQSKLIMTGKTGVRTHFIVPLDLVIPTAYAFIVCEIHRRNSCRNLLFTQTLFYSRITETLNLNKLFAETNLPSFESRKANRTLLTYNFEYAVNQDGFADLAYIMSAWLRSHKLNSTNLLPYTTDQYIESTNSDGSFEKIAFQLFRRGIFGWQISVILDIVYNSSNWTIEDKTKRVEELYKLYSPTVVDNLSGFLLTHNEFYELNDNKTQKQESNLQFNVKQDNLLEQTIEQQKREIKSVISELITLSHKEIVEKLDSISKGLSPAKVENSQCLKSGIKLQDRQCQSYLRKTCFGCKYLIPTTYALEFIEEDLLRLMDILENTPLYEENKIIKLSFMINKLFLILGESRKIFNTIDKNYIQTFIDLKLLKSKHLNLNKKYILSKGWKDGVNRYC